MLPLNHKYMINYKKVVNELDHNNELANKDNLLDFLDCSLNCRDGNCEVDDIEGIEDSITEYIDSILPVYYQDIVENWQSDYTCHQKTIDNEGEYHNKSNIYQMMISDLFYHWHEQLHEDYNTLINKLNEY